MRIEDRRLRIEDRGSRRCARGAIQSSIFILQSSILDLRSSILFRILLLVICILASSYDVSAQESIRLAVLDFAGDDQGKYAGLLRSLARTPGSNQVELLDEHLMRLGARGAGYDGSINFGREEARAFGQSLGCDFYILGRVLITRRAVSSEEFYFEALAGLFVIEARSGALIIFDFKRDQAGDEGKARERLE